MSLDPYQSLTSALAEVGLVAFQQTPGQLVVSTQHGPVWPNRGNSFWLTRENGYWYLVTWAPIAYQIPENESVIDLCVACINACSRAMGVVPEEIDKQFSLRRLGDTEAERLWTIHTS